MDLAPYERERKPRQLVTGKRVLVPLNVVKAELHCAICLDIFRKAAITYDCSHRFCRDCIEEAIRKNGNDCPKCRNKVSTRRALRSDENLDKLILALFKDVDQVINKEHELEETIRKSKSFASNFSSNAYDKRAVSPQSDEEDDRVTKGKKRIRTDTDSSVLFVLRKHPLDPSSAVTNKEFIKAPFDLTIKHIIAFLTQQDKRLSAMNSVAGSSTPSPGPGFEVVYCDEGSQEHRLSMNSTLADIIRKFNLDDTAANLILRYRKIHPALS